MPYGTCLDMRATVWRAAKYTQQLQLLTVVQQPLMVVRGMHSSQLARGSRALSHTLTPTHTHSLSLSLRDLVDELVDIQNSLADKSIFGMAQKETSKETAQMYVYPTTTTAAAAAFGLLAVCGSVCFFRSDMQK